LIFLGESCFAAFAPAAGAAHDLGQQQQGRSPMRSIISLYFVIGILLLVFGFFATGPCPNKNGDVVNDVVFVLTWPVGLYGYVIAGTMTPAEWLHAQACEGGLGQHGTQLPKPQPQ
jgi:hypothetical protein